MTNLKNYLEDGANYQARATLMFLQSNTNIEKSWNPENKRYEASIKVARWENCREQGYVVSIVNKKHEKLNIAFFEHRNSDEIHAVKWQQSSMNTITINNAIFGDVYKDKFNTSYRVNCGEVREMSEWIFNQLNDFWMESIY